MVALCWCETEILIILQQICEDIKRWAGIHYWSADWSRVVVLSAIYFINMQG